MANPSVVYDALPPVGLAASFYLSLMPARIIPFYEEAIVRWFAQRDMDEHFDKWLEGRRELIALFGTQYPFATYDPRQGKPVQAVPPAIPLVPPGGRARASWECLRLVHAYGEAEWQEVQQLHQEVRERVQNEEDEKRKREAELRARQAPPGRSFWGYASHGFKPPRRTGD